MKVEMCSFGKESLGKFSVLLEEDSEESFVVESIDDSHHLTNGVHGQARGTNIDGFDSSLGSHHRSNSASTSRVVSDNKVLERYINTSTESTEDSSTNRISHVTLVSIQL